MKVVAALSGGVDSSVAALLMVRAGHDVTGVFFRLTGPSSEESSRCCSPGDRKDAFEVAQRLGIPFREDDVSARFHEDVVLASLDASVHGLTPNPCAVCNPRVKFADLGRVGDELGADLLVTGHFARIERGRDGRAHLLRAADRSKDQSYFLHRLGQGILSRVAFPVGGMTKDEVRRIAAEAGLVQAEKAESQELCFVPEGMSYGDFVETRIPGQVRPGIIVDTGGHRLGTHRGIHRFTIGQRRGVGIAARRRLYVVELDAETGTVVVGGRDELFRSHIRAIDLRWIAGEPPPDDFRCTVQVRSRHRGVPAGVHLHGGIAEIELGEPVRAPAPGQAAVFYDGDEVLGGGWIAASPR